jgi:hypothetical protein
MKSIFFKIKDGVYLMLDGNNISLDALDILFATQGIKSKGKTIVIPRHIWRNYSMDSIASILKEKKINQVDRIFFTGVCPNDRIPKGGYYLRHITKRILFIDTDLWRRKDSGVTDMQMRWFYEVCSQMVNNSKFLLGQLSLRCDLSRLKSQLPEIIDRVAKREEQLKHIQETEIVSACIENIKRMKWIDKIEGEGEGLRILTKPMACTYVPNIAEFIDCRDIGQSDLLYKIMKYQFLGKYFIVLPEYYTISSDFNIKGDRNDRYPGSKVREIMQQNTYFHGMACHIGNGSACVGELASAIADANKNGLDMLLMSFEAYLRSINIPDAAGNRFYCLPMGDASGNVEVWPFVDNQFKKFHIKFNGVRNLENYETNIANSELSNLHGQYNRPSFYARNLSPENKANNLEACLRLIKEREPKIYQQIMDIRGEGVVA